jgi:lipopolysaccharide export system protein LptA
MQYFGSHSSGPGNVKVANSSDLLKAQKLQIIRNANTNSPKSGVTTSIHRVSPTEIAQYNAATQQLDYGVKHTAPRS